MRRLAANLLLAAASFAVCCAALEVAARVVVHRWRSRPGAIRDPLLRYHPRLGWDKPPGAEGWIRRPEYNVHIAINAHGLRGPDRGYEKPRGVRRTLLLGDSFTEGYTVAEEETVRARLEALLAAAGCAPHEVLNGGTAAYSTDQEYLFFLEEAAPSRGGRLVVFYVPARFEIDDRAWDLTRERYGMGRRWWRRERVFDDLRETCRALGLPLVDPRADMRAAAAAGRPAYFVRDGHWTAEGHAVAARRIAGVLRDEGLACPR